MIELERKNVIIIVSASLVFVIFLSLFVPNILPKDEEELEPFFSVRLIAPTSSPVRMQYAPFIKEELSKIGINTELDMISWAALGPRATDQEVGMYSEGGYDICFFGMSLGSAKSFPSDSLKDDYSSGAIPPAGFNVAYWSPETGKNYYNYRAQESDDLINQISTRTNVTEAKVDFFKWQKVWYDAMPNILIYNQYKVHAISSNLYGYDPLSFPLASIENQWFTVDKETVVLAVSTGSKTFNSIQAYDVYSKYCANPPMDGLVGHTSSNETVLPASVDRDTWMIDNFGTTDKLTLYPRMATSLGSFSDDGLQYNITVRDDIYWHDGHQFDAWDVAFSFQSRLIPEIGALVYSDLLIPFGKDNKTNLSGNYSFVVEDKNIDGFYESISFQFIDVFAPWTTEYLGSLIHPEHILGDPTNHGFNGSGDFDINQWLVHPEDWSTHSTSTGRTSDSGGYTGPIGTGSMIFKEYEAGTGIITLEKFEDVKWDGSAWVVDTLDHYNIANLTYMPDTATIKSSSLDAAIAEMKTSNVNIIDPQFTMISVIEELQVAEAIQPLLSPETGWQALYMNPKFVQDGIFHFQKKGVHHAISHIVPRGKIIHELMKDTGMPAYTPLPPSSWTAISESDLIDYKQSLIASDGTRPLKDSITAYDNYSISLALDWLETEDYNVTRFRDRHVNPPRTSPVWNIDISIESFIVGSIFIAVITTYLYVGFGKKN